MKLKQTPSQTIGPYFAYGLTPLQYGYPFTSLVTNVMAGAETDGERIRIAGRVLDGEGQPIDDAMIEIWQANAHGRYDHPEDTQDKPLDAAFGAVYRFDIVLQGANETVFFDF